MLKKEELDKISEVIKKAESKTSGEIRVYIARHCKGNPFETAFKKISSAKNEQNTLA